MTPAQEKIALWRADPVQFVRDNFKAEPDFWQAEFLNAFGDQNVPRMRIALQACAGPGKTGAIAWAGLNFMSCYGDVGQHPKGAAISVTADNLKDNLWSELSKWYQRSDYLKKAFNYTSERFFSRQFPDTWFLSARSFSRKANPDEQGRVLSGLHSEFVIVLIDESGDIPPPVLRAGEQALSNCKIGRIVQAGNPTSHEGMLYMASSSQSHLWKIIRITGDPDDPRRSNRIDLDWATEQIKLYGRDNPWVMAYILGKFPPSSINALIGPDEVEESFQRNPRTAEYNWAQKRLGVDVARFGDDASIIFPRQGLRGSACWEMRNADGPQVAAAIAVKKHEYESEAEFVDVEGVGASVEDALRAMDLPFTAVHFSGIPNEPRFYNKRSEMLWDAAAWAKRGGALAPDALLKGEMCAHTYTLKKGKIWVVEKDQVKKLIRRSPDRFDALGTTFAIPDMPSSRRGGELNTVGDGGGSLAGYNPIRRR